MCISSLIEGIASNFIYDAIKPKWQKKHHKTYFLTDTPEHADRKNVICRKKELKALKKKLKTDKALLLVNGFGGIGKTSLARLLFHNHKIQAQYDEMAWIPYSKNLRQNFLNFNYKALDCCKNEEERYNTIMRLRNDGKKKLFVIDNVEHTDDEQNPTTDNLLKTITGWPNTSIILTSRLNALEGYTTVPVAGLSEEACIKVFYLYYNEDSKRKQIEAVRKLVNLVGCHTFSVELIAKGAEAETDLNEYYEKLKREGIGSQTLEIDVSKDGKSFSASVPQHLKKLFNMQKRTEEEIKILNDFAVLPTASKLTKEELKQWFGYNDSQINSMNKLARYGWLSNNGGKYSMHSLVKEVVQLDYKNKKAPEGTASHFLEFVRKYETGYFKEDHTSTQRKIEILKSVLEAVEEDKILFADIYNNLGYVLHTLVSYQDALSYYQKALAIREEVLGENHLDTAATYNNMACVYQDQDDYGKALECYQKALDINEKFLDKSSLDTAATYDNISYLYRYRGDNVKALKYYQKALDIKEKFFDKDSPDTAATYDNIANLYKNQCDYAKALEYFQKALVIREKVLGKGHSSTATTYNNMADVYYYQSYYAKALEYYQKALSIREEVLGKGHPDTATTYNNMAGVYHAQGDYDKALEYYQKALAIREEVLGKGHPDIACTYNNMAGMYSAQGDYNKALEYYQKALAIFEEVLGKGHSTTACTYNNMASVYHAQGNYAKALEYCQKALDINEEVLGKGHPNTAQTYDGMGCIYHAKGDYAKALEYFLMAFKVYLDKFGMKHPYTLKLYNNLSTAYRESGEKQETFFSWLLPQLDEKQRAALEKWSKD